MSLDPKKNKKIIRRGATLAEKIRYSFLLLEVPLIILMLYFICNLWLVNIHYNTMIESVSVATGFSLDFKRDFDYETYLVVVGNKTVEESNMQNLLNEASSVVTQLENQSDSSGNTKRLETIKKYLENLATYKERIEENLQEEYNYEANIQIWENDVQIVTELLQESVYEYIYYEVKSLQESQESLQNFYVKVLQYSLIAFFCITSLTLFLSYRIAGTITKPVRELYGVMEKVTSGDLRARSDIQGSIEITSLGTSMNSMLERINDLMDQVKTEQINLRKAELELLQAQINPHFLYNTLDAIVWLAEEGEQQKVVSMVGSLSEFFRVSLSQGRDIIMLNEELRHVTSYLEIQQVRYQDVFHYTIDIPANFQRYMIPKITIQPLAENALYHGIKNKRGGGSVNIRAMEEENGFAIEVADDGIGMDQNVLSSVREDLEHPHAAQASGYGLYNVNARIRLHFGKPFGLTIISKPGKGTSVIIHLPKEKSPEDKNPKLS